MVKQDANCSEEYQYSLWYDLLNIGKYVIAKFYRLLAYFTDVNRLIYIDKFKVIIL